jgi:dipeptidyl aminopeptidase/acylaminoacyl peptidase
MNTRFATALFPFFLIATTPGAGAQAIPTHPPAEAFGELPQMRNPVLSPDGKHLGMVQVYKGRPAAVIRTLDPAGAPPVIIPYDKGFIVGVRWASNTRMLVTVNVNAQMWVDSQVNPWYRTAAMDPDGQNSVSLFSDQRDAKTINRSASTIVDLALDDPQNIYMTLYASENPSHAETTVGWTDLRYSVFKVDLQTGRSHREFEGGLDTVQWLMDGHGQPVARIDQKPNPLTDHLLLRQPDDEWKEVETVSATGNEGIALYGVSEDGAAVVEGWWNADSKLYGLVARDRKDASVHSLYFDTHFDVDDVITDPWTGRVVGASVITDARTDVFFPADMQELHRATLAAASSAYSVHIVNWDQSRQKVILAASGPKQPPVYYLFDRTAKRLFVLGRSYEALHPADLGDVKPYPYKARDGVDIPAYLTLPPGKDPKLLPVVIMPHGGPAARDEMAFDFEAQFLANRGYAVLQPNFRGSSGYGKKFLEAGYGEWGRKMQDDLTDGVKKLIADGIADPKRICIVGGSYGGYAALAGAAFTPDLYACAASWAGVSDVRRMLASDKAKYGSQSSTISAWLRFLGDEANYDAISPALHADQIKAPVLLMHGQDDSTVLIEQSERMEKALRHAGKKVTFITIDGETHHMQMSETRVRWLTELEKFLKENIGN